MSSVSDGEEDDDELMALEAEKVSDGDDLPGEGLTSILNMSQPEGRMPTPVPNGELAALPTNEDLFGNVSAMKEEHEKQRKQLEKQQEVARAKVDQGLQEKLRARRSRRDRMKPGDMKAPKAS